MHQKAVRLFRRGFNSKNTFYKKLWCYQHGRSEKKIPKISNREDPVLQTISFLKIIKGGEFQTEIFLNKMINKLWIKKDFILRRGLQILILLTNLEHRVFGTFSRKKTAVHLDFVQMRGGGGLPKFFVTFPPNCQ